MGNCFLHEMSTAKCRQPSAGRIVALCKQVGHNRESQRGSKKGSGFSVRWLAMMIVTTKIACLEYIGRLVGGGGVGTDPRGGGNYEAVAGLGKLRCKIFCVRS